MRSRLYRSSYALTRVACNSFLRIHASIFGTRENGHPATDRKAAVEMKDVFGDIFFSFFLQCQISSAGWGCKYKIVWSLTSSPSSPQVQTSKLKVYCSCSTTRPSFSRHPLMQGTASFNPAEVLKSTQVTRKCTYILKLCMVTQSHGSFHSEI